MTDQTPVEWLQAPDLLDYIPAVRAMEQRAEQVASGLEPELVWLVEHPPLYTSGTRSNPRDLLDPQRFPVYATGRGGEFTYHGPGQRIAYVVLDVRRRFGGDVRAFVCALEAWLIASVATFGVEASRLSGRTGVWVERRTSNGREWAKLAAIGLRVRRGVSFHGVSLNIAPDLAHYDGIVPCGVRDFGVTSLADLGIRVGTKDVDNALRETFAAHLTGRSTGGAAGNCPETGRPK